MKDQKDKDHINFARVGKIYIDTENPQMISSLTNVQKIYELAVHQTVL